MSGPIRIQVLRGNPSLSPGQFPRIRAQSQAVTKVEGTIAQGPQLGQQEFRSAERPEADGLALVGRLQPGSPAIGEEWDQGRGPVVKPIVPQYIALGALFRGEVLCGLLEFRGEFGFQEVTVPGLPVDDPKQGQSCTPGEDSLKGKPSISQELVK
jgi:hypothetical protein